MSPADGHAMNLAHQEAKPRWVKVLVAALLITMGAPVVLSFVFFAHYQFWQLLALLLGCFWLFVCGFFTAFKPLPIARYLARPGTYELMLRDKHPAWTRWYFRIVGAVMMLIALALGTMFYAVRATPPPRAGQRVHP